MRINVDGEDLSIGSSFNVDINGFDIPVIVVESPDFFSCKDCYYDSNRCTSPFVCGALRGDGKRVMFKEI